VHSSCEPCFLGSDWSTEIQSVSVWQHKPLRFVGTFFGKLFQQLLMRAGSNNCCEFILLVIPRRKAPAPWPFSDRDPLLPRSSCGPTNAVSWSRTGMMIASKQSGWIAGTNTQQGRMCHSMDKRHGGCQDHNGSCTGCGELG